MSAFYGHLLGQASVGLCVVEHSLCPGGAQGGLEHSAQGRRMGGKKSRGLWEHEGREPM